MARVKDVTVRGFPKDKLEKIRRRMERAGIRNVSDGAAVRFAAIQAADAKWQSMVESVKTKAVSE